MKFIHLPTRIWVGLGLCWLGGSAETGQGEAGSAGAAEVRPIPSNAAGNLFPLHREPAAMVPNRLPKKWRFRADPQDLGDVAPARRYFDPAYDDSRWEEVDATAAWKGEGAAWYRGALWWNPTGRHPLLIGPIPGLQATASSRAKPPPHHSAPSDHITVYVNGVHLQPPAGQSWQEAIAARLVPGYNLLAVKVEHWPNALPPPSGPEIGEVAWRADWSGDKVRLTIAQVEVHGGSPAPSNVRLQLLSPRKQVIGAVKYPAIYLPARLTDPLRAELAELGRYHLELTVGRRTRRWTFHSLGLCVLNRLGQEAQDGYLPLDNLLAQVAAEGHPHHVLSLPAWFLDPLGRQSRGSDDGLEFPTGLAEETLARTREALAAGRLDCVGEGYGARRLGEYDGETLIRSLRYGKALLQSQLGMETPCFWSYDGSLTPQLPQLLLLGGYDTCLQGQTGGDQGGFAGPAEVSWRTPDGSSLPLWEGPYPGFSLEEIARRAVRQGRPVALGMGTSGPPPVPCWEAAESLAQEGIFLQKVSLAEYRAALRSSVRPPVLAGDDQMAYPGWTGGTPPEIAAERAYRLAAAHLVAADNLMAAARLWGIPSQGSPEEMDRLWKACLLDGEAPSSNGNPSRGSGKRWDNVEARAQEIIRAAAAALAQRVRCERETVVVVNPLGWPRSGWVHVPIGPSPAFLATPNGVVTQQRAGEADLLFWAEDVPAVGWRTYKLLRLPQALEGEGPRVKVQARGMDYVLQNPYLGVAVSPDGCLSFHSKGRTLRAARWNQLWAMRPPSERPPARLSTPQEPLNLDYYATPPPGRMDLLESGPARATVRVITALPGYPGTTVEHRISLAAGARRVEIELHLNFSKARAVGDPSFPAGTSGPYIPGLFVAFPCSRRADLLVDQAYCLARHTLHCVNYGIFPRLPFHHCTTRGLSLAAPDTAEFALLTHGLTHFFLVPEQRQQLLGLSLGTGFGPSGEVPYQGHYVFKYALLLPGPKELPQAAYTQAQEVQVPLQGVVLEHGSGDLPEVMSCFSTGEAAVPLTGVQFRDGQLAVRLVDLTGICRTVTLRCPFHLTNVTLAPAGKAAPVLGGAVRIDLPPRAVREIRAQVAP